MILPARIASTDSGVTSLVKIATLPVSAGVVPSMDLRSAVSMAPRPISFDAAQMKFSCAGRYRDRNASVARTPFSRFQSAAIGLPSTLTPG